MKLVVTLDTDEPLTLEQAELIVEKAFQKSRLRRPVGVEDHASVEVSKATGHPAVKVRWEVFSK